MSVYMKRGIVALNPGSQSNNGITSVYMTDATGYANSQAGTSEELVKTVNIPDGLFLENDVIRITHTWEILNSANAKTLTIRVGETGHLLTGLKWYEQGLTTNTSVRQQLSIAAMNSRTSQLGFIKAVSFGNSVEALRETTLDTTNGLDINFSTKLANTSDTAELKHIMIEILRG